MKKIIIITAAVLAVSCATGYEPEYRYNQLRILNNSDQPIRNLTIQDRNIEQRLECGNLTAFGFCQHPIPKRRYQGLPMDVSWVTSDGTTKSQSVVAASKGPYTPGTPIQVELNFAKDGSLSGVVEQQSLNIH